MGIRYRWPINPNILPDELLSSWLYRCAKENGQKMQTFCDLTSKGINIHQYDIDLIFDNKALESFCIKLAKPKKDVFNTLLSSYNSYLYHHYSGYSAQLILKAVIYDKDRPSFGHQFCPQCLATDPIPYFRRVWRTAFVTVCPTHGCYLRDRCESCGSPINFIRTDIGQGKLVNELEIYNCHHCHSDLSKQLTNHASQNLQIGTRRLLKILNDGFVRLPNNSWLYSFSYFGLVRYLMQLILKQLCPNYVEKFRKALECQPLKNRVFIMKHLFSFLKQWPEEAYEFFKKHRFTRMSLINGTHPLPFWFERSLETVWKRESFKISEEEAESAIRWLIKQDIQPSIEILRELFQSPGSQQLLSTYNKFQAKGF